MKKAMEDFGILELFVYKDERFRWVFDDKGNGLSQEPFVAGMDEVIDLLTVNLPNHGYDGFKFCMREHYPDDEVAIELTHYETMKHPLLGNSNYYWCEKLNKKVWLCHNLYKYVNHAPQVIFCWCKR